MNKPVKSKLCWNCEGNVSRVAENCPYCGVYLSPDPSDQKDNVESTLLKPHYSPGVRTSESEIPKAPYTPQKEAPKEAVKEAVATPVSEEQEELLQGVFLPVFLLSTGLIALFFALILVLFSTEGTLTLQWSGDTWYYYALASLPLLFFGWKYLD